MSEPTPARHTSDHSVDGRIRNVSKDRYASAEWLSREWQQVWKKPWQAAAHLSDLQRPGDFAGYDIGPESIPRAFAAAGSTRSSAGSATFTPGWTR
jgi:hypothetical protein